MHAASHSTAVLYLLKTVELKKVWLCTIWAKENVALYNMDGVKCDAFSQVLYYM